MKCPLLSIGLPDMIGDRATIAEECIKEECAWWSVDDECCFIKHIAKGSFLMVLELCKIARELTLLRPPRR